MVHIILNNKKHLQSDSILAQLKYGMTIIEVIRIVGNQGSISGSGRAFYEFKLPDGRSVKLVFDSVLSEVYIQEVGWEWPEKRGSDWLGYDLNKQELLIPFLPDSLIGIQYGMMVEEVEKIFVGDYQINVSFFGRGRARPISLSSYSYPPQYTEQVNLLRLSTGEWVNIGFESVVYSVSGKRQFKSRLLYVNMKADDEEWYVYDLNTQELTKERVAKDKIWEGRGWN